MNAARAILLTGCVLATGCYKQQMAKQPKFGKPDQASELFADGRASRPIEPDTVARGQLRDDAVRYTGQKAEGGKADAPAYSTEFPYPISMATMERGRERFNVYCSMCHGRDGYGRGKVVQRGYATPPSFHEVRLREMPVGRFYEVITRGHGAMPDYDAQIPTDDRWAIIAYVRALQLSQNVPEDRKADYQKFEEETKTRGK